MVASSFTCRVCGQSHEEIPLSFAADFPDMFANLSEGERERRALIGSDQCIMDEQWFFLRGCLEIPIIGRDEVFLWGLWASVKAEVFDEVSASWEEERREKRYGPFKGRLANSLSIYPESLNLKLSLLIQPVGTRPYSSWTNRNTPCNGTTARHLARTSKTACSELTAQCFISGDLDKLTLARTYRRC
jgi:hypothetical protein